MEEFPQSGKIQKTHRFSAIDAPESFVKIIKQEKKTVFICRLEEGEKYISICHSSPFALKEIAWQASGEKSK